jgi:hypothetical protein
MRIPIGEVIRWLAVQNVGWLSETNMLVYQHYVRIVALMIIIRNKGPVRLWKDELEWKHIVAAAGDQSEAAVELVYVERESSFELQCLLGSNFSQHFEQIRRLT